MASPRRRKGRPAAREQRAPTAVRAVDPPLAQVAPSGKMGAAADPTPVDPVDRWFVPIALGILLVAAAFRLPELALNPLHHDEGVNGYFTTNLVRTGVYVYDPENYHGPSLYYLALISQTVFGLTTEALRLVPVMFGLLTVGLVLAMRRFIGTTAVLVSAGLLAISPGGVYVSRYFIHEALLVAMTVGLVVALLFYLERRNGAYEARYLLLAAVAAALLFTTKETAAITVAVLVLAVLVALVYQRLRGVSRATTVNALRGRPRRSAAGDLVASGPRSIPGEHLAGAAMVFLVIYVLLFSSFFTNFPNGLTDSFAAYVYWFGHGDATQIQPFEQYLVWTWPADAVIVALGIAGGLIAAIRATDRLWLVIALWAAGISVAYSLIPYKTPWIVANMLLPLALLGGHAIAGLWQSKFRLAAPLVLLAAAGTSGYFAYDLNFVRYDDQAYGYVYVHSTRDMLRLVDEIETTAERAGTGRQTGIVVMSPDYWPLPWYLRDYPRAGFYGSIVDTEEAEIVANVNQESELAPQIQDRYRRVGVFNLRPGVDLVLYVRTDVPE